MGQNEVEREMKVNLSSSLLKAYFNTGHVIVQPEAQTGGHLCTLRARYKEHFGSEQKCSVNPKFRLSDFLLDPIMLLCKAL